MAMQKNGVGDHSSGFDWKEMHQSIMAFPRFLAKEWHSASLRRKGVGLLDMLMKNSRVTFLDLG